MKKLLSISFLLICILVAYMFFNKDSKLENFDKKNTDLSILKNSIPNIPNTLKTEDSKIRPEVVYQVEDSKFNEFEKKELEWEASVAKLFSEEEFRTYMALKEENDREKLKAYQEYHDYLRQKQGENFKYNVSEDQSALEKKVNDIFLDKLLKVIGENKFKAYAKMKLDFNEKMRRDSKGQNAMIIEF